MMLRRVMCFVLIATCASTSTRADENLSPIAAIKFMADFCVDCHGPIDQETERRFDQLTFDSESDRHSIMLMRDAVDQLVLGDMPPEDAAQPSIEERQAMIGALRQAIIQADLQLQPTSSQTVLRRLNRREYLQTISDLFDMDMSMFDPTSTFPSDSRDAAFDNFGDALVTSSYLLENYLEAAEAVVQKALADTSDIGVQEWVFRDRFDQQPEINAAQREAFANRFMCLYDCPQADRPEGAFGPLLKFKKGVPVDGMYRVRVLAQAMNHDTPYRESDIYFQVGEPFRMGVVPGDTRLIEQHTAQPIQPVLAQAIIEPGDPKWHEFKIQLDARFAPRFTFLNGMFAVRDTYARLTRNYPELLPESKRKSKGIVANRKAIIRHGFLPHIRIHEVQIQGPIGVDSAKRSRSRVLGSSRFDSSQIRDYIRAFADRAYRRPVTNAEVNRLMQLVSSRRSEGRSAEEAFQDAIKSVLCSPSFLYLQPLTAGDANSGDHALASRLSYFLWSTMPDDRLRKLADDGQLSSPDALHRQVERLINDDRSDVFLDGFLDGWLHLHTLGDQPPDRKQFREYYADSLHDAMRRESREFMRHLIATDASAIEWLSADYSFVNRDLARLYECGDLVDAETGHEFRKVVFSDRRRGGLFGQASVLTVTANGIETSPVIRGVWVLENVLGKPTPPPPDDVPAIDPDVRGATSIRDQLEKHRQNAACNQCHRRIDPLGFALEEFDPIGRVRPRYKNKAKIDTAGKLPNGESFADISELKKLLLERSDFFARHLTERLFEYALGRRLAPTDHRHVDQVMEEHRDQGYPLRSLIHSVVASELFQQP